MDDTLIKGGTLDCGCPWYHDENYPEDGHVPRHVANCAVLMLRRLTVAIELVARDLWMSQGQRVSGHSWDEGHLDNEVYTHYLEAAALLVKSEADEDEDYGARPQALRLVPSFLLGSEDAIPV